jgi:plasmid maintenance system antidote protein VapI
MTANQFNKALDTLGIGQTELANALEINDRTIRRFAAGEWPVPIPIAMLLNLMLKTGTNLDDLRS